MPELSAQTDRERFLALLKDFGITPQLPGDPMVDMGTDPPEGNGVHLVANHGGVEGYTGFLCRWEFDDEGRFKGVSVWE